MKNNTMASNGTTRNRKHSGHSEDDDDEGSDSHTQRKSFKERPPTPPSPPSPPMSSQDSPANGEELNPGPPIKIPARAISAVESRLLSLATKEKADNDDAETKPARRPRRSLSGSQSPSRKSRSPDRKRGRSSEKRKSPKKSSTKKKSRSPANRKRRSPSRSRSRSGGRSRKRRSSTRSPPRRKRSRSKDRKRSRSRDRKSSRSKRSRSRSRDRRRSRSRSHGRKRSRSRDRKNGSRRRRSMSRSRSPSPKFTSKWGQKPNAPNGVVKMTPNGEDKSTRVCTTEDVEKRLAQHMKQVQEKAAEDAKKINLPGYLNPAMVNVHQFKQVQDKKKLLWGKTKEEGDAKGTKWAGAFDDTNNDGKFRRLMGIHQEGGNPGEGSQQIEKSRKVLDDLEKEYEKSRAFQMSRGAGGVTGIGLGFGSAVIPQPPPQ